MAESGCTCARPPLHRGDVPFGASPCAAAMKHEQVCSRRCKTRRCRYGNGAKATPLAKRAEMRSIIIIFIVRLL